MSISRRHRQGVPPVTCFSPFCRWHKLVARCYLALLRATSLSVKDSARVILSVIMGVLGSAPPGPLLDEEHAKVRSEWWVGPQGCEVLMWECAGSLAGGNFFISVPLDGTMLLFSVTMSRGGPDGQAGRRGAPYTVTLPRKWPPPMDAV